MESTHAQKHTIGSRKLLKIGSWLGMACAIHCVLTPLVLALLPLIGAGLQLDHRLEIGLLLFSSILSTVLMVKDKKEHHSILPLILLLCGFFFLVLTHILNATHVISSIDGGLLLGSAFLKNYLLVKNSCKTNHIH